MRGVHITGAPERLGPSSPPSPHTSHPGFSCCLPRQTPHTLPHLCTPPPLQVVRLVVAGGTVGAMEQIASTQGSAYSRLAAAALHPIK